MKTSVQIVEEMMDVLDCEEHWCKEALHEEGPQGSQYCLMGAINKVVTGSAYGWVRDYCGTREVEEAGKIIEVMGRLAYDRGYESYYYNDSRTIGYQNSAVMFNNAPETTFEDLRLFLKETKVELEIAEHR